MVCNDILIKYFYIQYESSFPIRFVNYEEQRNKLVWAGFDFRNSPFFQILTNLFATMILIGGRKGRFLWNPAFQRFLCKGNLISFDSLEDELVCGNFLPWGEEINLFPIQSYPSHYLQSGSSPLEINRYPGLRNILLVARFFLGKLASEQEFEPYSVNTVFHRPSGIAILRKIIYNIFKSSNEGREKGRIRI